MRHLNDGDEMEARLPYSNQSTKVSQNYTNGIEYRRSFRVICYNRIILSRLTNESQNIMMYLTPNIELAHCSDKLI